ncbi:DUF4369 domain-containing protein [Flavobacterium sp.]|uniref:DUF4369 domain-containing protein n=1 Tax=Flavobacterium sp. TaxID=239 RepID=UPI0037526F4B
MQKSILSLLLLLVLSSCSEKKQTKDLLITGYIKGLKKGTLYIQKLKDTTLIALDTIKINGDSHFASEIDIDSPEMYYLFLDRGVSNSLDNNIAFFAEKGKINIETSLDFFSADTKITGSKSQEIYEEYRKVVSKLIDQDLSLLEKKFAAYKQGKTSEIVTIDEQQKSILKRKYLYTTNFAVNHKDSEVAPYIAIAEIYDINLIYLDTIQKSLTPKVSKSMYGKQLDALIKERRETEK